MGGLGDNGPLGTDRQRPHHISYDKQVTDFIGVETLFDVDMRFFVVFTHHYCMCFCLCGCFVSVCHRFSILLFCLWLYNPLFEVVLCLFVVSL